MMNREECWVDRYGNFDLIIMTDVTKTEKFIAFTGFSIS